MGDPRVVVLAFYSAIGVFYQRGICLPSNLRKRAKEIGFTESDALELEVILANEPDAGDVIPGGAGLRKVRCALAGRGKSGGARVIYFYRTSNSTILLFSVFAKNEGSDVLKSYLKFLVQIVKKEIK